jgi:ATP-dependent DNA helicase RecG
MISSKTAAALIQELNQTDETEHLEAKECKTDTVSKTVYETICALSNEPELGGGTILLGVEKEFSLFPIYAATGITAADKLQSDIASACSTMFNSPIRVDLSVELVGNSRVIRIDVPELPRNQKPLYFRAQGLPKGAFRRHGPTDVRCTDEDLIAFFQSKTLEPYDSSIIEDATWDDIDSNAIGAYRRSRAEVNHLAEELNWSDEDMLHALGAVKKIGGNIRITVTGLTMFGTTAALRRLLPSLRVDYIRVPGNQWVPDPDKNFESIDMRGPLLLLIPRVIAAIIDDLPKAFGIDESGSGQRSDLPIIPFRVVREAAVNAMMHRSYQVGSPVQIIRYSNRIVLKNPGYSLKSQDRFDDSGSALRNPHIAEILHETRFAETKGSGIRVMRTAMAKSGLSAPTFDSNRDIDEFTAIFLLHHFLTESDWVWLGNFKGYDLSEDQTRALIFVREVGAIDNSSYRSLIQTDTLAASRSLRQLRMLDILSDRGSGARTHYVAGPKFPADNMDANTAKKDGSMDVSAQNRYSKGGARLASFADLPPPMRLRLQSLGKRLEPRNARDLIAALCEWRPLSAEEIAGLLGKTADYVSQKYLYAMVRERELSYLYPEMVKHPGQKYTCRSKEEG